MGIRSRVALGLFAALVVDPSASAQIGPRPVDDLLRPPLLDFRMPYSAIVPRPAAMAESMFRGEWHRVVGEGHLVGVPALGGWGSRDAAENHQGEGSAWFDSGSLIATLASLGAIPENAIRVERAGHGWVVRSEIPERLDLALDALRAGLPAPITVTAELEVVSGADGSATGLVSGDHVFTHGEVATLSDFEGRSLFHDVGVEIAQAAATTNPELLEFRVGASVTLRARGVPGSDACIVEAVARVVEPREAEPIRIHPSIGPLDRLVDETGECGATFRLSRGGTVEHEWTMSDGRTLRLTCSADWQPPKLRDGTRLVVSPLLGKPVLDFRSLPHGDPEDMASRGLVSEHVRAMLDRDSDGLVRFSASTKSNAGMLVLEGGAGTALLERIGDELDRTFRPVAFRLEVLDVPAGSEAADPSGSLPEGHRIVADVRGATLIDHSACYVSAAEKSYVREWEVEVAQASRMPDPIVDLVETGTFVTLRPMRGATGDPESVEIRLDLERLVRIDDREFELDIAMSALAPVTDDARPPAMWMPQNVVRIERPVERKILVHRTLRLDADGRATIRRSATRLFGEGRELLVRVAIE